MNLTKNRGVNSGAPEAGTGRELFLVIFNEKFKIYSSLPRIPLISFEFHKWLILNLLQVSVMVFCPKSNDL